MSVSAWEYPDVLLPEDWEHGAGQAAHVQSSKALQKYRLRDMMTDRTTFSIIFKKGFTIHKTSTCTRAHAYIYIGNTVPSCPFVRDKECIWMNHFIKVTHEQILQVLQSKRYVIILCQRSESDHTRL